MYGLTELQPQKLLWAFRSKKQKSFFPLHIFFPKKWFLVMRRGKSIHRMYNLFYTTILSKDICQRRQSGKSPFFPCLYSSEGAHAYPLFPKKEDNKTVLSCPSQAELAKPRSHMRRRRRGNKKVFFLVAKSVSLGFPCREDLESIFIIIAV